MATIEIEATYRVTTPMFCGGANQQEAELRLSSFKGVLRFWWRALAWARLKGDLTAIKREEDALFGSAGGGQARVLMRLDAVCRPEIIPVDEILTTPSRQGKLGEGARYLGYGVMHAFDSRKSGVKEGQLTRACLRAPFRFTVRMRGRNLNHAESRSLSHALTALGVFGGMGAKSRKGYGSLVMESLRVDHQEAWQAPQSIGELCDRIGRLRPHHGPDGVPDYTALTHTTRHVLATADRIEPLEVLDLVGREMVRYRSWGPNGSVFGRPSEKNFEDDHDLMKIPSHARHSHPRRIAFGLPHNYGRRPDDQVGPAEREFDRRASPLFIHIHECGDTPVAVLSFLPARFLPEGKSDISVGGKRVSQRPEAELYRPIHGFLDRLLDPNRRKEPFAQAVEAPS